MATRVSLLSLLPFLLLATLASASIEDVCKRAAVGGRVDPNDCIKTLQAVPDASTADDGGLAAIAGNLGVAHAQATLPTINNLLESAGAATKGLLQDCQELYGDAIDNLNGAAAAVERLNLDDANICFSAAMDAAATCEEGFADKHVQSPLTAEDSKLHLFATIGAAITWSMIST